MFLHWLVTVFPVEMREGWNLVRPDLLVWIAVAILTVFSPFLVGTTGGVQTSVAGLVFSQFWCATYWKFSLTTCSQYSISK